MMQNEMIHTGRVLIVEGKYDAARLAHLTDAMILLTDGFGIYKDKKRQQLFKALAQKHGVSMPITEQLYHILFDGADPKQALDNLMSRPKKHEYEKF